MDCEEKMCHGSHPATDEDHINRMATKMLVVDGISDQLWESSCKHCVSVEGEEGSAGGARLCVCV